MNLNALKTFALVAELLSFSAAARHLNIPRATVSARVQELEKNLGVRLFLRNNRHVSLTPEGQDFLFTSQQAITLLDNAQARFASDAQTSGLVRLGLPAAADPGVLDRLQAFCQRYPNIKLELLMSDDVADLAEHRIDLSIRGRTPASPDLIARPLPSQPMLLVATPDWIRLNKPFTDWQQLAVHDPHGQSTFSHARPAITTTDLNASLMLCLHSTGAAILPQVFCTAALASKQLQAIEPPAPLPALPLYLVYLQRKLLPERTRLLIDFLIGP